jgi:iron complex transport system substrate-binding protein
VTRAVTRLLAVLTLACLFLPEAASALTITDQTGRRVVLPALPGRIVSLVPSVTETVFTIGAQDRLVGVTDFCDYPPAARQKPSIGGMISPNLEGIVAL